MYLIKIQVIFNLKIQSIITSNQVQETVPLHLDTLIRALPSLNNL